MGKGGTTRILGRGAGPRPRREPVRAAALHGTPFAVTFALAVPLYLGPDPSRPASTP